MTLIASATETVVNGSMLLAIPVSFFAGFLSFASPCILPLVPGYLSYLTGMTHTELLASDESVKQRSRILLGTLGFIGGFSALFVSYGLAFGQIGNWFLQHVNQLNIIFGIGVILMGASYLGWLPFAEQELRPRVRIRDGVWTAPLLGLLFGIGWSPCVGPTLAAVQTLAMQEGSALRGATLSLAYSLGLGLPFVFIGLGYRKSLTATKFLRQHSRAITRIGGAFMVLIGFALITGFWNDLTIWLRIAFSGIGVTF